MARKEPNASKPKRLTAKETEYLKIDKPSQQTPGSSSVATRLMDGIEHAESLDWSSSGQQDVEDETVRATIGLANNGQEVDEEEEDPQDDGPLIGDGTGGESRRQSWFGLGKLNRKLALALLAGSVGASFQHGYNGGVVNAPEKLISQFINDTLFRRNGIRPSEGQVDLVFAVIVSVFCIGGCLGALMTAPVADRLGRKEGLFHNNLLVLIACPLMASSRSLASYELLILGRLLIGINAGLNAGLAPLYVNEISPAHLRGSLGTLYQLTITCSILASNLLGLPSVLGTTGSWPYLFAFPLLPAALVLLFLPHCPESPRHLLVTRGREFEAQQALAWLRGSPEVELEMEELRAERERALTHAHQGQPAVSLAGMLGEPSLRRPLIVAVVVMLSQQLSGINAVLFFSTSVFRSLGLTESGAAHATLGMSLVNVLVTFLSLLLVERAGRKTLYMAGLLGMAVCALVLGLCLGGRPNGEIEPPPPADSSPDGQQWLAVICVYLFVVMFATGPGSIPWFLVSELFPAPARPLASSIAVAVNWLANFAVSLSFLPLTSLLHGYTFFLFAGLLLGFYLFTHYRVPETRGATPEEVAAIFLGTS